MPAAITQAGIAAGLSVVQARIGGANRSQTIKSAGLSVGLSLLSYWLRPQSNPPGAARTVPYPALTPKFALGECLMPAEPCWGIVRGGSLHMAVPISIGTCEGMRPELVLHGGWNHPGAANPTVIPLKQDGRLWTPAGPGPANAWSQGTGNERIKIWEYPEAADHANRWGSLRAVAPGWDDKHRMSGIAGIHVELRQGPAPGGALDRNGRFWTGEIPRMSVLWRGIKPTWPGYSTRTWTDSPAALRYWFYTERLGVDPDLIDSESVRAAHGVCSETIRLRLPDRYADEYESEFRRYALNGYFAPGDTRAQVEQQMDFGWLGEVLLAGGRYVWLPGAERRATREVSQSDFTAALGVTTSGPPADRLTGASCVLAQSRSKRFRAEQSVRYEDETALAAAGGVSRNADLGRLAFEDNAIRAVQKLAYLVRFSRNDRRWRYRVRPGAGLQNLTALPGEVARVTEAEHDLLSADCELVRINRGESWDAEWELRRRNDWSLPAALPEAGSVANPISINPNPPPPPPTTGIYI